HEILRTRFQIREGRPVQVIDPPGEIELPIIDLSDLAESFRDEQVRIVASEQAARHFDLERGPVWRAELLRLASKDHVLLLNIHHVASDGWSTGILIKEFTTLYEGYREGLEVALPELAIQYADYAAWQREWLQGERLEEQIEHWRRQLAGAPLL